MRSSSSRSVASVCGAGTGLEFTFSTLCSGTAATYGDQLLMSTRGERPGSRLLVREAPQRGEGHPVADGVFVEVIRGAIVDAEVGELQFERRQCRRERHVPVVVAVVVDVIERVVAEPGR